MRGDNYYKNCLRIRIRSASTLRPGTAHHPQTPALQEFNHSLTCLSRQLAMAHGVIFGSELASPSGVIVQRIIHKHLHFKNSITHSLACLDSWSWRLE